MEMVNRINIDWDDIQATVKQINKRHLDYKRKSTSDGMLLTRRLPHGFDGVPELDGIIDQLTHRLEHKNNEDPYIIERLERKLEQARQAKGAVVQEISPDPNRSISGKMDRRQSNIPESDMKSNYYDPERYEGGQLGGPVTERQGTETFRGTTIAKPSNLAASQQRGNSNSAAVQPSQIRNAETYRGVPLDGQGQQQDMGFRWHPDWVYNEAENRGLQMIEPVHPKLLEKNEYNWLDWAQPMEKPGQPHNQQAEIPQRPPQGSPAWMQRKPDPTWMPRQWN